MADGSKQTLSGYWAAAAREDLGGELDSVIQNYYSSLLSTGRVDVWRRSYRLLYGWDPNGLYRSSRQITMGGEEGEVVHASANILRSLTRAMHTQITGSRASYTCRTTSDDAASLETVKVGNALLDFYWTEAKMEQAAAQMAWYALPSGEGWLYTRWDPYSGKPAGVLTTYRVEPGTEETDPETGEPIEGTGTPVLDADGNQIVDERVAWKGDIACTALKPEDVIRDIHRTDTDHDWLVVSTLQSRWDLIARFPEYSDEIRSATPPAQWTAIRARLPSSQLWRESQTDVVPVFELWHRKTDAIPAGRHVIYVGGAIVVDEPMEYPRLPCVPMIPNLEIDSCYGYGETWDLNNLQQAITSIITQVVSTRENFGARNMWVPPGTRISSSQIGQGFRAVESAQKPEIIDMGEGYVGEASSAIDLLKGLMQLQTGMNDTVLGDASKSQSGEALRMLHSMALQYNSGLASAYAHATEQSMSNCIDACKLYMKGDQVIPVVGRGNAQTVKRFKAEDLGVIESVRIEMNAAAMNTSAGRKDVADRLLQAQAITPVQYLEMQKTGRLESALDYPFSQRVLVDTENERLKNTQGDPQTGQAAIDPTTGEPLNGVKVLATDDHAYHIKEHTICVNDPDIRLNNVVAGAVLAHIQEHVRQWSALSQAQPAVLAATGQQPAPMPPPPPMPDPSMMGAPGAPPPEGANPGLPPGGPGGEGQPAMDPNIPPADVGQPPPEMEQATI